MANRNFKADLRTKEQGLIELDGWVELTSAAAINKSRTWGFSIAKTGTGAYTITLDDPFMGIVSVGITQYWNGSTGNIQNVVVNGLPSAVDVAAAPPTIVVNTMSAVATVADTTSTMGFAITILCKNSGVIP